MIIDVITYKLAEGVTDVMLQSAASDISDTWMKKQPGFIKWEINKSPDGESFKDLVYWKSLEAAEAATKAMSEIPQDHPWLKCYDMSTVKATKVTKVMTFGE